jgi:hypothetical protein
MLYKMLNKPISYFLAVQVPSNNFRYHVATESKYTGSSTV